MTSAKLAVELFSSSRRSRLRVKSPCRGSTAHQGEETLDNHAGPAPRAHRAAVALDACSGSPHDRFTIPLSRHRRLLQCRVMVLAIVVGGVGEWGLCALGLRSTRRSARELIQLWQCVGLSREELSVSENGARRRPRVLSPEAKWEIFLEVVSREVTQAEAARRHGVDVSTIIGVRRTVKDAALAGLVARPGRRAKERNWEMEAARREVQQLTEAVKVQAIELALLRGEAGWA